VSTRIPLVNGGHVLVDDDDAPRVSGKAWRRGPCGYAQRSTYTTLTPSRKGTQTIHRLLMAPPAGCRVVFVDGDPLNCQRSNLAVVTNKEYGQILARHRAAQPHQGYRGVHPVGEKWVATIRKGNVATSRIGTFPTAELAARAYDEAARKRGTHVKLNFPEEATVG
jgi:hypothetical protein